MYWREEVQSYVMDRRLKGVGRVRRSLQTKKKAEGHAREGFVIGLQYNPDLEPALRAFTEGPPYRIDMNTLWAYEKSGQLKRLVSGPNIPLKRAVELFLEYKESEVAPSTWVRYREGLAHFQRILGDDLPISHALDHERIAAFKGKRLGEVLRSTINKDLIAISCLATYAKSKKWINERPVIKKYPSGPRIRFLSDEQEQAYMDVLPDVYRPLMRLLIASGMRLGEAEEMLVSDLADGEHIMVRRSKSTAGIRPVYVPPELVTELREWAASRGLGTADKLFGFKRWRVQQVHRVAREMVGLADYRIHDHRHTYAVRLCKSGAPMVMIQMQLGHRSVKQTEIYTAFHPDYKDIARYVGRK